MGERAREGMSKVRHKVTPYMNGLRLESHPRVATRAIGLGVAAPSLRFPYLS